MILGGSAIAQVPVGSSGSILRVLVTGVTINAAAHAQRVWDDLDTLKG